MSARKAESSGKLFNVYTRPIDNMDFEQYVTFANTHPFCSLATVDGDQPQVRMLGMWFADTNGFYFSTQKTKAIYRQLLEHPKVAICFYAPPEASSEQEGTMDIGTMMRVTGTAEVIGDPFMKERLFTERPFLRPFAENVVMFRVKGGETWSWTFADNGRESTIERILF